MDKKKIVLTFLFYIFSIFILTEDTKAKSLDKKKFIKEYDKIVKSIKKNNNKRTKVTYQEFSKLEKKYDLEKINSKKRIAYLNFYICEGAYRYDSSDLELAASKCKKADTLYRKARLYNSNEKSKSTELYIAHMAGQLYAWSYYYSNSDNYYKLAKKYSNKIIESSKLNSKKFDNFLTSAFKNKVIIFRVRLNLKKALKYQKKVLESLGCFLKRSELKKNFLKRCTDENSDYSTLLMDTGIDENYDKAEKILKKIIKFENEDEINIYTKNNARNGLYQFYIYKRNYDEAEKYIYEAVTLLEETNQRETYYENLRKLYKVFRAKGQSFEAKEGFKNLILEIEDNFGEESVQLITPISDYINITSENLNNINDNEKYAKRLIKILKTNKKYKIERPYAYASLGSYYYRIEKFNLSEIYFEKSLEYKKYRKSQVEILLAHIKIELEKYKEAEKIISKFEHKNTHEKMLLMFANANLNRKTKDIQQYQRNFLNLYYNIFDYSRGITSEKGSLSINSYYFSIIKLIRDVTNLDNDKYEKIKVFFNENNENLNTSIIELLEILRNSKINKSVSNVIDRFLTPELEVDKKKLQNLILEFEKLPKITEKSQNVPKIAKQLSDYKKEIFNQQKLINSKLNIKNSLYYEKIDKKLLNENIKKNQAIISYFIDEKQLFLNYLSKEKILIEKIDIDETEISNYVSSIRNSILIGKDQKLKKFDFKNSSELYNIIIKPIQKEINDKNELIIIPHKSLLSLPFEVLLKDYDNQINYHNAKWLGKKYSISYHPSIYSYLNLKNITFEKTNNQLAFLGLGDPKFKIEEKLTSKKTDLTKLMLRNIANVGEINKMTELPETADELKIISNIFNNQSKLLLGKEFTENKIKSMDLSNFKYIAFATHAIVANQITNIAEPGLILTPPSNPTTKDDGILTVSEINKLNLKSDIVILSACNTASEDGSPNGEGLSGLTSAFFQAGTKSMLVTHWDVETNSAVKLTTGSLKNLENSESLSRALQKTKISMMNDKETSHPFYWAPFVLIGNL
jgi:CHAT domain-containing protein